MCFIAKPNHGAKWKQFKVSHIIVQWPGCDSNLVFPGAWFLLLFPGCGRVNLSETDLLDNASVTLKPLHFLGYTVICCSCKFSLHDRYVMNILDLRSRKVTVEQNTAINLAWQVVHSQPVILLWNEHLNKNNYWMEIEDPCWLFEGEIFTREGEN